MPKICVIFEGRERAPPRDSNMVDSNSADHRSDCPDVPVYAVTQHSQDGGCPFVSLSLAYLRKKHG